MTSEIHPKLPANLLRMSNIFTFEPPPGIKANLQVRVNTLTEKLNTSSIHLRRFCHPEWTSLPMIAQDFISFCAGSMQLYKKDYGKLLFLS